MVAISAQEAQLQKRKIIKVNYSIHTVHVSLSSLH